MAVRELSSIKRVHISLRPKVNHLKKIRVAAVSYLNTKPLLYGIKRHPIINQIELIEDYPSKIAEMLAANLVDIGLIPVAAILKLKSAKIVGKYCIGCNGPVASVCLFSEVPIEELEKVYLDYQSSTSVNLAKVLLREYWKKQVVFIDTKGEDFRGQIKDKVGGVVIGDRALEQRLRSTYIYDLGEAWKNHTGKPFVFAAWITNKTLPDNFTMPFDEANGRGLLHLEEIIKENPYPTFDLKNYFTKYISYDLTEEKREGLSLFLQKLSQYHKI
ncbi:MAG: menaquinone biosynthesis protein [Flavisolibacter sp.]